MLQLLRLALCDFRMKERQMDGQIGVFMHNLHENRADCDRNAELLPTFADERRFLCLSLLHLAADKFPQKPSCFICRTLTGKKFISVPNECRYHFCHAFLPFRFSFHYKSRKGELQGSPFVLFSAPFS